jgi:hypothetical protein
MENDMTHIISFKAFGLNTVIALAIASSALIGPLQAATMERLTQPSGSQSSLLTEIASKSSAEGEALAKATEAKLNDALKRVKGTKRFVKLVASKDADGIAALLQKTAGVTVPLAVNFGGNDNGAKPKWTIKCSWPPFKCEFGKDQNSVE